MSKMKRSNSSIKVGDVFVSSWGYGQTNVNAFQVVRLVGKASVEVREIETEAVLSPGETMADRNRDMCGSCRPARDKWRSFSTLIDDQENGSRKQVIVDDSLETAIKVGDGCFWAFKWDGMRQYRQSWYY